MEKNLSFLNIDRNLERLTFATIWVVCLTAYFMQDQVNLFEKPENEPAPKSKLHERIDKLKSQNIKP